MSIRRSFTPILSALLCFLLTTTAQAQPARYPRSQLQADFDQLVAFIHNTHPQLARNADLSQLAAATADARQALRDGMTIAEAWMTMATINPLLGDAHCGIRRPGEISAGPARLLPLAVEVTAANELLVRATAPIAGLQVGDRVNSVNSFPVAQIIDTLLPRMRGETLMLRRHLLSRHFAEYHWLAFGGSDLFELTVGTGAQQRTLSIAAGAPATVSEQPFELRLVDERTAYMEIRSFELELKSAFESFLRQAFADIAEHGSTQLIIDLRRNGGGARDLSDLLMAYLTDKPYSAISAVTARVSEENIARLPGAELGQVVALPFKQTVTPPAQLPNRFKHSIHVLIGPHSYSQAVVFAATVQDHQIGKLAGRPSASPANQSGQVKLLAATHSGIQAMAPLYVFTRASGVTGTAALEPDLPLSDRSSEPMHAVDLLLQRLKQD